MIMFIAKFETNNGYYYLDKNNKLTPYPRSPIMFNSLLEGNQYIEEIRIQALKYARCLHNAEEINARVLYGFVRDHHKQDLLILMIDSIMDKDKQKIQCINFAPHYTYERIN